jgi:hypothetical protein
MARMYNTPPQKRYENKPIGGFLTARQAAYIAAGAALGLLFSSPLGRGLNIHTLIPKGLVVLVFAGIATVLALARAGEMPLDSYLWLMWRRRTEASRHPWKRGGEKPSAQDFLGIRDIRDGIVEREDGTCCLIMEVGGINYFLLSEAEQGMVDVALARMLKPISRPLTVHAQTRYMDAAEALAHYREAPRFEGPLADYSSHLVAHMEGTLKQTGVLVQRYYMAFHAESETTREELVARAVEMAAMLQRVRKTPARILGTDQVAELVHVANNKERSRLFRAPEAAALGYFDLTVQGRQENVPETSA